MLSQLAKIALIVTVTIFKVIIMLFKSMSPQELGEKLENKETFRLIDVREPIEWELARIEGAELLPLSEFSDWHDKLNASDEIVVMCHHGVRSAQVCAFLSQQGFEKIWNLSGGIDAWSIEVDRNTPRY